MIVIIILLFLLLFFTRQGGAYTVSQFTNVQREIVIIPDVIKIDVIDYVDAMGRINKYSTRHEFYKDWRSDAQISQIMKHGNKLDKMSLILLFSKLLYGRPEEEIIGELFAVKSDKKFYEGYFKKHYKASDTYNRARARALIAYKYIKFLKIPPGKKLLEIGCGDGSITEELNKLMHFGEIHCIEPMNGKSKIINYHKPTSDLIFNSEYFDVIYCSLSLHHVPDLEKLVRELYRVMKPGGYLILREHISYDVFDAMLIDIEHMAYIIGAEGRKWEQAGIGYGLPLRFPNVDGWDQWMKPFEWYSADDERIRKNKNFYNPTLISWIVYTKGHKKGSAEKNPEVTDAAKYEGVKYKKLVVLDARNPGITYYDYNGDLKQHDTFSNLYKSMSSGEQIKQIIKYGAKIDKSNLILLMIQLIKAPEQQIINDLFNCKKDGVFYKKYKDKIILPDVTHKLFTHIKFLKIPPGKRFVVFGGTQEQNMKLCEMIGCAEIHAGTLQNLDTLKNNYYDCIIAIDMLGYVADISYVVRRFRQIIKKSGYLVIRETSCYDVFEVMIAEIEAKMFGVHTPVRFPNDDGWDIFVNPFKWYSHQYEIQRLHKNFKRSTRAAWSIYTP